MSINLTTVARKFESWLTLGSTLNSSVCYQTKIKVADQSVRRSRRLRSLSPEYTQSSPHRRRDSRINPRSEHNIEEVDHNLQDYISQGLQELLDQPDHRSSPPREASLPISQVIPYSVDTEHIPQSMELGLGIVLTNIGSLEFS